MSRLKKTLVASIAPCYLILVPGCTWVEPIGNASSVSLSDSADISGCERIGTTTSSVKDQLGWFQRGDEKVASELLTLAQNSAASMGGNTLVATADPEGGSQQFVVYSCPDN